MAIAISLTAGLYYLDHCTVPGVAYLQLPESESMIMSASRVMEPYVLKSASGRSSPSSVHLCVCNLREGSLQEKLDEILPPLSPVRLTIAG
jgi:hypothetical protein